MIARRFSALFVLLLLATPFLARADKLTPGNPYRLTFQDVDGNDLSTADGHVTIITVVTRDNEEQARAVADLVPSKYVGDPGYRYVTLVNFQRKLAGPLHGLTRTIIRNRLDAEAKALKPDYEAKKVEHDPRRDLFVIADFDGSAVEQLGLSVDGTEVAVFVFDHEGNLKAQWDGIPEGDAFAKAIGPSE